jgi:hypothetical protein
VVASRRFAMLVFVRFVGFLPFAVSGDLSYAISMCMRISRFYRVRTRVLDRLSGAIEFESEKPSWRAWY